MTLKTKLEDMIIGDKIIAKYVATNDSYGVISELGTSQATLIPTVAPTAPNGSFYFVYVADDFKGRRILIADRNIQDGISWDKLNTAGVATKDGVEIKTLGLPSDEWNTYIRLLTGGVSSTSTSDSEWDRYIVNSTLNGTITSGDNNVWNWDRSTSWTSTSNTVSNRVSRGFDGTKGSGYYPYISTQQLGFRPVLIADYLVEPKLNKTLILHNDEYKKFIEATEYKAPLYSDNIIPIMTSNTAPSGIAMASSELTDRGAYKAFNDTNGTEGGWSTNSTTSGWIYYKFPESKIISKYTIQAFDSSTYINRAPKTWTFEGSNDGDVWNVLDTVNNFDGFVLGSATHEFTFVNSTPYLYYRLNVSANNGNASYLQINRLTMHEISQKEIPKSNSKWVIISDILPTVNQFVDNGMDSLTPLLDRKVRKLEPQVMIQDSTPVGNGKVYRKKVNLNKYFDIRTISTETRKS